jgi:hypothetical protein
LKALSKAENEGALSVAFMGVFMKKGTETEEDGER